MTCKNCGAENAENTKFCQNCGTAFPTDEPLTGEVNPIVPEQNNSAYNFAVASLVLGIISFFCFSIITGILAIVFGAIAKNKGSKSPMATAGMVCGIIALVLWFVSTFIIGSIFKAAFTSAF